MALQSDSILLYKNYNFSIKLNLYYKIYNYTNKF